MNGDLLLANLISLFHVIIVLFVLIAPFTGNPALMILHIVFSVSLLVHWWANNNLCSLTLLEAKLRGLDHTESFTHQFIGPVYDISNTDWSNICYILTIILMSVSFYNLYHSPKVADALRCFNSAKNDNEIQTLPLSQRLKVYSECFAPVLRVF